jgi:transcriptional regulator with XRE-family HTH domain
MDIRLLRKTARLTQLELAQQTGISRVRLSFAECGYCELTHEEVARIQEAIAKEPGRRADRIRVAVTGVT